MGLRSGRARTVESPTTPPVRLAVTEYGDPAAATHVVLVHGFPDDQRMWDPTLAELPEDWHVVTYDTRGSGRSTRPTQRRDYDCARMVDDLVAVLDATVPEGRVHLVAHDWGSIATWDAVAAESADARLRGRLASYTSCSGPSLDHIGDLLRDRSRRRDGLRQGMHSWYVWMFQSRLLTGLMLRATRVLRPVLARIDPSSSEVFGDDAQVDNARHAVELYRANVIPRMRSPRSWRTSVPAQVVVALRDGYVLPETAKGLGDRCAEVSEVEVDCGHWVPRERPAEFARLVSEFVAAHP